LNIISASRRTDIPAFHGDWFYKTLKKGKCEVIHPFTGTVKEVSLKKEDIWGIVFWSKNYIPFTDILSRLSDEGYQFYLNYTVNNFPALIEHLSSNPEMIIDNLSLLSRKFDIFWRYDPVYISEKTDTKFHLNNFKYLCEKFSGKIDRVIINFIQEYGKVIKHITSLPVTEFIYQSVSDEEKLELALKLKHIADGCNIRLYSCTSLLYKNSIALKSHCVDKFLIEKLTGKSFSCKESPAYKGCHCHKSIDIGKYNTCMNNCIYCYAK
jgi:hypothetical protein